MHINRPKDEQAKAQYFLFYKYSSEAVQEI